MAIHEQNYHTVFRNRDAGYWLMVDQRQDWYSDVSKRGILARLSGGYISKVYPGVHLLTPTI